MTPSCGFTSQCRLACAHLALKSCKKKKRKKKRKAHFLRAGCYQVYICMTHSANFQPVNYRFTIPEQLCSH